MKITFATFEQFREMEKTYNIKAHPLCAGFGLGTNVSAFLRINGNIYARLTPIAYPEFAGTTKDIGNCRAATTIEDMLRRAGQ